MMQGGKDHTLESGSGAIHLGVTSDDGTVVICWRQD